MNTTYEGLVERFMRQNFKQEGEKSEASKQKAGQYTIEEICTTCKGSRYNENILQTKVLGYNIAEFTALQIDELINVVKQITEPSVAPLVANLIERLTHLVEIGLDYVTLDRETATLSGGESQRVKMVKHLTSSLTDVVYIFDEPSIGLHPRDVHRLNELIRKLRDKGNTVIVVEHDPDVIRVADHIVDMGPLAGVKGGEVCYEGSFDNLIGSGTLTGQFLSKSFPIKMDVRKPKDFLVTSNTSLHNLKNVSLRIPVGLFTVVTGVAGSGKSTLVNGVFSKEYPEAILVDQSPVSGNLRSNAATYTGIMDNIRKLFSVENSVSAGLFSYNSEGACEMCSGRGFIENDLAFMTSVETVCEACGGNRFKTEVLSFTYKDKNIVEVLALTIEQAKDFFTEASIKNKLKNILEVGLGYITLGQTLDTLSGGECQRLKLAKELSKKGNIYILDEPTTGLHMSDIKSILKIINKLVDKGNTVVVIEHNLDVIRNADWIIELGFDGGSRGGEILFEGEPIKLKSCERSITAKYI